MKSGPDGLWYDCRIRLHQVGLLPWRQMGLHRSCICKTVKDRQLWPLWSYFTFYYSNTSKINKLNTGQSYQYFFPLPITSSRSQHPDYRRGQRAASRGFRCHQEGFQHFPPGGWPWWSLLCWGWQPGICRERKRWAGNEHSDHHYAANPAVLAAALWKPQPGPAGEATCSFNMALEVFPKCLSSLYVTLQFKGSLSGSLCSPHWGQHKVVTNTLFLVVCHLCTNLKPFQRTCIMKFAECGRRCQKGVYRVELPVAPQTLCGFTVFHPLLGF